MKRIRRGRAVLVAVAAASAAVAVSSAGAGSQASALTPQASMLTAVAAGAQVAPIITVGETLPNGYRFESIPDGISYQTRSDGAVDVFVNHETSTVPFPYVPSGPTEANSQNDFDNSQLSKLRINKSNLAVTGGQMLIQSGEGYQRFCSNYLAKRREGFNVPLLFTNEEGIDWVNRTAPFWPATIGAANARQIGAVVALEPNSGQHRTIWGMGRHNHENSVAIPGYDDLVLLSGDDSFVTTPAQSQLYSYIAPDERSIISDQGDLWAFVSDVPAVNDYFDFVPGSTMSVSGRFIKVDKDVATGRRPDGTDLMSFDKGYPAPPNDGSWQRDPRGIGIDGPQWVLETWGDQRNVFQFVRIEDIAYDKRPGMQNVVYVVDSGRGTAGAPGPNVSTNGRVWKLVLDPSDPTRVLSFSVLIEGDDNPVKTPGEMHQPDNIESTPRALLFAEDPGSSQQFNPGEPNATEARLWRRTLSSGAMDVVAKVNQSADEGATDVDPTPAGRLGAWESSGIIDMSEIWGPGTFLIDVQAHTLWVEKAPGPDLIAPPGPDWTYKREGGQLVAIRIPGA